MGYFHTPVASGPGIFARNGQLYVGGPSIGMLQKLHPASRLLGLFCIILALTITRAPLLLLIVFSLGAIVGLLSYLNMRSVFRLALVPVILFALPAWLVAYLWNDRTITDAGLFFLRTLVSVSVVSIALHSIGLKRTNEALKWMRIPVEIQVIWSIMISQVVSFSEILAEMLLARDARKIQKMKASKVRLQIGRQAGVLFGRMNQRGRDLAFAMESRCVESNHKHTVSSNLNRWNAQDFLFMIVCVATIPWAFVW